MKILSDKEKSNNYLLATYNYITTISWQAKPTDYSLVSSIQIR